MTDYEQVKHDILEAVKEIERADPKAGAYLREHMVFDDVHEKFKYTGKQVFELKRAGGHRD